MTVSQIDHLLYKAAVSLSVCGCVCMCVCVCVCVRVCLSVCLSVLPPLFSNDRLTATTFGTHMRIDPGIIRTKI